MREQHRAWWPVQYVMESNHLDKQYYIREWTSKLNDVNMIPQTWSYEIIFGITFDFNLCDYITLISMII